MARPVSALALAAVLFVGCGGTQTRTVTVTRTVTEPAPATSTAPAVPTETAAAPEDYCASAKGDEVVQAASEAQGAFNDASVPKFSRAVAKALRAAKGAPAGADCAAQSLNEIVDLANSGSGGNLAGLDVPALVKRVRSFQRKHGLRG